MFFSNSMKHNQILIHSTFKQIRYILIQLNQYYKRLLIYNIVKGHMSFSQRLRTIQNLILEDTALCIETISSKKFINSLFFQQLKSFTQMFEQALSKKGLHLKGQGQGKNLLRPQLVVAFYSVIIMRSSMVNVRQEVIASIATKVDQNGDLVYNSKVAVDTLSKIYRSLEENDKIREVIVGLLLKIRGFNNYKMIVKDLHPDFVSQRTMDLHFEGLKSQCPNLLEAQILKFKQKWSKFLKFKTISLSQFQKLLDGASEIESQGNLNKWDGLMQQFQVEVEYLHGRFKNIQDSNEVERVNIDDLINNFDSIYTKITEKLKEHSIIPTKKGNNKAQIISPEYDYKQFVLKNYIKIFGFILSILNKTVLTFHINWIRKIKWLYNYITTIFVNFGIKSINFHASIAKQYSRIVTLLLQILMSYLITFKNGLFPIGRLQDFAFTQQFSIYKLVQALLYNEYPFDESQAIVFQNYQKQRKNYDNKQKQHIIDIVNFNMKSLNINPHWDNLFGKLIPNLKNSHIFAKELLNSSIFFLLQYFKITFNYQHAAKLILMLTNAKNTVISTDKSTRKLINQLKALVYPGKQSVKGGIQYFCEEYFNEYIKINHQKQLSKGQQQYKLEKLQYFHCDSVNVGSPVKERNLIKKTQSRDAIIQGWEQNFQSVKDSSFDEMKGSSGKNQMLQSAEIVNNDIFYSVKEGNNQKQSQKEGEQNNEMQIEDESNKLKQDGQILLPEF